MIRRWLRVVIAAVLCGVLSTSVCVRAAEAQQVESSYTNRTKLRAVTLSLLVADLCIRRGDAFIPWLMRGVKNAPANIKAFKKWIIQGSQTGRPRDLMIALRARGLNVAIVAVGIWLWLKKSQVIRRWGSVRSPGMSGFFAVKRDVARGEGLEVLAYPDYSDHISRLSEDGQAELVRALITPRKPLLIGNQEILETIVPKLSPQQETRLTEFLVDSTFLPARIVQERDLAWNIISRPNIKITDQTEINRLCKLFFERIPHHNEAVYCLDGSLIAKYAAGLAAQLRAPGEEDRVSLTKDALAVLSFFRHQSQPVIDLLTAVLQFGSSEDVAKWLTGNILLIPNCGNAKAAFDSFMLKITPDDAWRIIKWYDGAMVEFLKKADWSNRLLADVGLSSDVFDRAVRCWRSFSLDEQKAFLASAAGTNWLLTRLDRVLFDTNGYGPVTEAFCAGLRDGSLATHGICQALRAQLADKSFQRAFLASHQLLRAFSAGENKDQFNILFPDISLFVREEFVEIAEWEDMLSLLEKNVEQEKFQAACNSLVDRIISKSHPKTIVSVFGKLPVALRSYFVEKLRSDDKALLCVSELLVNGGVSSSSNKELFDELVKDETFVRRCFDNLKPRDVVIFYRNLSREGLLLEQLSDTPRGVEVGHQMLVLNLKVVSPASVCEKILSWSDRNLWAFCGNLDSEHRPILETLFNNEDFWRRLKSGLLVATEGEASETATEGEASETATEGEASETAIEEKQIFLVAAKILESNDQFARFLGDSDICVLFAKGLERSAIMCRAFLDAYKASNKPKLSRFDAAFGDALKAGKRAVLDGLNSYLNSYLDRPYVSLSTYPFALSPTLLRAAQDGAVAKDKSWVKFLCGRALGFYILLKEEAGVSGSSPDVSDEDGPAYAFLVVYQYISQVFNLTRSVDTEQSRRTRETCDLNPLLQQIIKTAHRRYVSTQVKSVIYKESLWERLTEPLRKILKSAYTAAQHDYTALVEESRNVNQLTRFVPLRS